MSKQRITQLDVLYDEQSVTLQLSGAQNETVTIEYALLNSVNEWTSVYVDCMLSDAGSAQLTLPTNECKSI